MSHPADNRLRKTLSFVACGVLMLSAGALAFPSAAMANKEKAQNDFTSFAGKWMANLENTSKQNRTKANVRQEGNHYYVEYVTYGPEWTSEIKETGEPAAPYVGFLKYSEKVMTKEGQSATEATQCAETISSQVPVTEIFRYSKGKWQY